jgi:hypothetical protein
MYIHAPCLPLTTNAADFFPSISTPEARFPVSPSISRASILQKLHDTPFMVQCSPVATLAKETTSPSAWLRNAAEEVHSATPSAVRNVQYFTMVERNPLGDWVPGFAYCTAAINQSEGYKSVVEAALGTRLWLEMKVVDGEEGLEIIESMKGNALLGMGGFVEWTFAKSHKAMVENLIQILEKEGA